MSFLVWYLLIRQKKSIVRCHVTDDDNRLRFMRMSRYLSSWGADRPFAHLDHGFALANNIALTVVRLLLLLLLMMMMMRQRTQFMGVARGCSGCRCTPEGENIWGRGLNLWGKLLVHPPEDESALPSGRMRDIFIGRRTVRRLIQGY